MNITDTFSVDTRFQIRKPVKSDASSILELVRQTRVLEPNSCYAYLILCQDFFDTCIVAEIDDSLVGFIVGYRPPSRPESLFVWQIGVSKLVRQRGLGTRMLLELLKRLEGQDIRFLEATVTPRNIPSRKMFEAVARKLSVAYEYHDWFESKDFEAGVTNGTGKDVNALDHEPEQLIRIGPLQSNTNNQPIR